MNPDALGFGWAQFVVLLVAAQRLGELVIARRNTQALLAAGAREVGAAHYPLFILLHGSWLLMLFLVVPSGQPADWLFLGPFVFLQIARVWVVASLGRFWTTRIITLDAAPLVKRGPYRVLRHPNYVIVAGEILLLPLAFGALWVAILFSLLNACLLIWRIRLEEQALAGRREQP
ncbi:isoprenylcysteine carboxyl methyltransferase family protein [Limibacillus halophilus]|uniref:Methyltransferase n=1 Tax=Limibacillus halophilus TaxID=1579333 RepID=A0A839SUE9_9PROT|nr:isoprenylcysteine carboxylmethyltransferase family protein [Limibacillus halophilus]MBB3066112.1 methyltransferase [Limibacillus halophilus]